MGKTSAVAMDQLKVLVFTNVRTDGVDSTTEMKDRVVSKTPAAASDLPAAQVPVGRPRTNASLQIDVNV
ncbi:MULTISPECIES: hypothetical protein [unclassified Gordonia (in: high G+C Gram-positive bacteria)]|uniref:hypothetical protein n=1 Tax=Gordonia TaxID=2053 RepID=UPI00071D025A|nr:MULTISPECIES: hypothetical protein [unclassified Gordonia (in: high G+C Gram-positive bacteria)]KSU58186.1 hypothetical protein AS181_11805 [Gordonia sp. SGD-V-85]MBR7195241.1 hypothetical protein [Gordonia sp. SCSIO 19800]MDT0219389.1 hypothetical protein [Gordonia sp. AC31]SCC26750.1 hypothetical protein GA0061091_108119 [Gordonia sp. v-85]